MRSALSLLVLGTLLFAASAGARVAVAVSIPDANAVHREFAAGIVGEAESRFDVMSPPLPPSQLATCGTDEKCLLEAARGVGASHLLVIGVAALGPAEFVVSVRMLDVKTGEALANISDIATPGRNPREEGFLLAQRVLAPIQGVPEAKARPPAPEPPPDPGAPVDPSYSGVSVLSVAGWSIVGAAVAGGTAGLLFAWWVQTDPVAALGPGELSKDPRPLTWGIGTATGVALAAGLGLVVLDQVLAEPDAAR